MATKGELVDQIKSAADGIAAMPEASNFDLAGSLADLDALDAELTAVKDKIAKVKDKLRGQQPPSTPPPVVTPPPPSIPGPQPDSKLILPTSNPYGLSNMQAVGEINAGENFLRLDRNPGFRAGDWITVPVGYEAGRGMRGTMGVGGSWPRADYPSTAELQAAIGKRKGHASIQGQPEVWWVGDNNVAMVDPVADYYRALRLPLALVAQVTDVSTDGLVLRLDRTARATVQAAPVHFDNMRLLNRIWGETGAWNNPFSVPDGTVIELPEGAAFVTSGPLEPAQKLGMQVRGNGAELWSPPGTNCISFVPFQCPDFAIRDLTLRGNHAPDGYVHQWYWWRAPDSDDSSFPPTLVFTSCNGASAKNLTVINPMMIACGTRASNDVWADNITVRCEHPMQTYLQWMLLWADSGGGGCRNSKIASDYLVSGIEAFGSNGVLFQGLELRNAAASSNSCNGTVYDRLRMRIEQGCQFSETSFSHNNPGININSNIASQQGTDQARSGCLIKDIDLEIQGPIGKFRDLPVNIAKAVSVEPNNSGVRIEGGRISLPNGDYSFHPADQTPGYRGGLGGFSRAIDSAAPDTVVKDLTVEFGLPPPVDPFFDPVQVGTGTVTNVTKKNRLA